MTIEQMREAKREIACKAEPAEIGPTGAMRVTLEHVRHLIERALDGHPDTAQVREIVREEIEKGGWIDGAKVEADEADSARAEIARLTTALTGALKERDEARAREDKWERAYAYLDKLVVSAFRNLRPESCAPSELIEVAWPSSKSSARSTPRSKRLCSGRSTSACASGN